MKEGPAAFPLDTTTISSNSGARLPSGTKSVFGDDKTPLMPLMLQMLASSPNAAARRGSGGSRALRPIARREDEACAPETVDARRMSLPVVLRDPLARGVSVASGPYRFQRRQSEPGSHAAVSLASMCDRKEYRRQVHLMCEHRRRNAISQALERLREQIAICQMLYPHIKLSLLLASTNQMVLMQLNLLDSDFDACGGTALIAGGDDRLAEAQVDRMSKQALLSTAVGLIMALRQIRDSMLEERNARLQ